MLKNKVITAIATGAFMLASLTPLASAATVNTNVSTQPVSSVASTVNGLATGVVSTLSNLLGGNQVSTNTNVNVLGNTVSTSTQLGL